MKEMANMNRIEATFKRLKDKKEKALVGFVTAGDPDIPVSLEIIRSMCRAGMDVLELGVPFSDPTADGPVIQRSSARALQAGVSLAAVLQMTRDIRQFTEIPIILFSYYNPILAYGLAAFYDDVTAAGADGVLVVDLPPEESDEMTSQWSGNDLALIRLIAPTTPSERMGKIAASASGFLYLVSKTGVTGSAGLNTDSNIGRIDVLRSHTDLPVCVGFGVTTPEDVSALALAADGVVVGTAFERTIEENREKADLPQIMYDQTHALKQATIIKV
jgi:tryptophan synthase alpha chain